MNKKTYKIGLSHKTFKNGAETIGFFKTIQNNLKRSGEYSVEYIDLDRFDNYRDVEFDLIITFSYFPENPIPDGTYSGYVHSNRSQLYRQKTENLKFKNILYIESPICYDLLGSQFRINLNSIYFYKNQLPDLISESNRSKLRQVQKSEQGDDILILLQNPLQYFINMTIKEYGDYINNIIRKVREKTDKKLIVRYKPGRNYDFNIVDPLNNLEVSNRDFIEDCQRSYKCIAHSTNAVSTCVYYGLDIISLSEYNLAYEFSEKGFDDINTYNNVDYSALKKRILSCAYGLPDLASDTFSELVSEICD